MNWYPDLRSFGNFHLLQITNIFCAPKIKIDGSFTLESFVFKHNNLYLLVTKSILKPKFYIFTHYSQIF